MDKETSLEDQVRAFEARLKTVIQAEPSNPRIADLEKELLAIRRHMGSADDVLYFSSTLFVPKETYKVAFVKELSALRTFSEIIMILSPDNASKEELERRNNLYLESSRNVSYTDDTCAQVKAFYTYNELSLHMIEMHETLKENALAYARNSGYAAVMINEPDIKFDKPGYKITNRFFGHDMLKSDVTHRARALVTFYTKEVEGKRW